MTHSRRIEVNNRTQLLLQIFTRWNHLEDIEEYSSETNTNIGADRIGKFSNRSRSSCHPRGLDDVSGEESCWVKRLAEIEFQWFVVYLDFVIFRIVTLLAFYCSIQSERRMHSSSEEQRQRRDLTRERERRETKKKIPDAFNIHLPTREEKKIHQIKKQRSVHTQTSLLRCSIDMRGKTQMLKATVTRSFSFQSYMNRRKTRSDDIGIEFVNNQDRILCTSWCAFVIEELSSSLMCEWYDDVEAFKSLKKSNALDSLREKISAHYLLLCRVIWSVFDCVSDSNVLPLGPPEIDRCFTLYDSEEVGAFEVLHSPLRNTLWERNLTKRSP